MVGNPETALAPRVPFLKAPVTAPILCPHGKPFDSISPHGIADAGRFWHMNRAVRRDLDFRLDDIFIPIALARRNISRKRETRERRQRDVVRPSNTCLQHSSAP